MRILLAIISLSLISSCSYKYESTHVNGYSSGWLVHTVTLKLKDSTTEQRKSEIIDLLQSLKDVPHTHGLTVAERTETNDERADRSYDLVLQMGFRTMDDLLAYSTHEEHLKVRSLIKHDLAKKPVVYDYTVK